MTSRRLTTLLLAFVLLSGSRLLSQGGLRPSDPRIRTTLAVTMPTGDAAGRPILVDVHLETIGRGDVRRSTFSRTSSFEGLPDFRFVSVPDGDTLVIPPGLFVGGADAWDRWYLPPLRAYELIIPAARRVHLLHGDLRLMLKDAEKHCRQALITYRVSFERPDQASTKKEYENIVRFAGSFRRGGTYDVTVWAYSQSNTVRIRVGPSR